MIRICSICKRPFKVLPKTTTKIKAESAYCSYFCRNMVMRQNWFSWKEKNGIVNKGPRPEKTLSEMLEKRMDAEKFFRKKIKSDNKHRIIRGF